MLRPSRLVRTARGPARLIETSRVLPYISNNVVIPKTPSVPVATARQGRYLSTTAVVAYQGNQQFYRKLVKDYGPVYAEQELDTAQVMDSLRDMQSLRSLKKGSSNSGEYKAGLKAISQLIPPIGGIAAKPRIRIADIERVLSLENGVVWRLLRELLEFGFSSELTSLTQQERLVVKLNRVHGFGKIRSEAFVAGGAKTFEDLMQSKDQEYGRKVSGAQKLALEFHHDMEQMITRSEITQFKDILTSALKQADPAFQFEIMGSYRRGEEISSDIDMVVWHPSLVLRDTEKRKAGIRPESLMYSLKTALVSAGLITEDKIFSQGEKKILALTQLPSPKSPSGKKAPALVPVHRQIDIRLCPLQSLPYMLLGNSGDDTLMKILRWRAAEKGWVLNEYGMGERIEGVAPPQIREGSDIIVRTEQEIFALLEVSYIPPEGRSYHKYKNLMRKNQHLKNAPDSVFAEEP